MNEIQRVLSRALRDGLRSALRTRTRSPGTSRPGTARPDDARPDGARPDATSTRTRGDGQTRSGYLGDYTGPAAISYRPDLDGGADPGEVVWTWVPYEEDHSQGKDRPVLVVARLGGDVLALMMTSKDHDRDAADEAKHGRVWMDIGSGAWDRQGRPSEVRLDRVLRFEASSIRREGAVLERDRFAVVATALRRMHGWT